LTYSVRTHGLSTPKSRSEGGTASDRSSGWLRRSPGVGKACPRCEWRQRPRDRARSEGQLTRHA